MIQQEHLIQEVQEVPFINLRFEEDFEDKVMQRWKMALDSRGFIAGEACKELEESILEFTKAKYFTPCANGTDAIQLALRAVGVGKNDKVLLPDFTFWATYEAVLNVAAEPIMVDINPQDFQMDFDLFVLACEKYKPKAAIIVHLYGWCSARLDEFRSYCKKNEIFLIEDGAQSIGSKFNGEPIFQSAFLATTSFYPAKVLGAAGDAGGVFSSNREINEVCTKLANHGRSSHYGHEYVGWNSRMDELQAHFLVESLKHLQARIDSRREAEHKYLNFQKQNMQNLNLPLQMKECPSNVASNGYLQVSIAKTSFKELSAKLKEFGIGTGNVYPSPMSAQVGAKSLIQGEPLLVTKDKVTYEVSSKVINLPLFPYITDPELQVVMNALKKV
ncbi:MAG: DegT/DnrJ/EryC1/StrS family aminotransferase [Candidatus Caenarcaniphilales bacterium]|nr:DegT/DnrJ/EryC1/StrS family aminotransferase [Candidatus Caenarcaniphilales bacterium]